MFSAFLNPLTFIVGGALVLTPIVIHLINRIRFRRVQWAAMEFLLKAQKKQRRRKILEQLILLLLRCLLVFLVGLLLARYIGGCTPGEASKQTQPTTHVIVIDDTPSMADGWRREDGGGQTDALAEGKRLVADKLVPATAEAQSAQTVQVIRLSDLEHVFPEPAREVEGKTVPKAPQELRDDGRVNFKGLEDLRARLNLLTVSVMRRPLLDGLRRLRPAGGGLGRRGAGDPGPAARVQGRRRRGASDRRGQPGPQGGPQEPAV
jgi:hypothetical protein